MRGLFGSARRAWRSAALATIVLATVPAASATAASAVGPVRLYVPAPETTIERFDKSEPADFAAAFYVAAADRNFEVHVKRATYRDPIGAEVVVGRKHYALPQTAIRGFAGFAKAVHIHVAGDRGRTIADYDVDWCPNDGARARLDDSGPPDPIYPYYCDSGEWTKGAVWGVEQGWAATLSGYGFFGGPAGAPVVPDGHYHVTATWNPSLAFALDIDQGSISVGVKVTTTTFPGGAPVASARTRPTHSAHGFTGTARRESSAVPEQDNPNKGTLPDLIPTPSSGISTFHLMQHDYLAFGATVWNAGPAPMVVEGFRQPGKAVMDAYEYFYRDDKRVGRALVGTMAYDPRVGHQHWHFKDFAKYELLDNNQAHPVRSGKEAFCLANTDSIDMLVKNANWRGNFDDLGSVCGGASALWLRETLSVGYGDTYTQYVPGQSFDITNMRNGTYYIRVTANPAQRLKEVSSENNTSLRKVIVGGTPGNRTVSVPPYQGL
jgi:lysyl oxidase